MQHRASDNRLKIGEKKWRNIVIVIFITGFGSVIEVFAHGIVSFQFLISYYIPAIVFLSSTLTRILWNTQTPTNLIRTVGNCVRPKCCAELLEQGQSS